jgi:hypothetical protein
VKLQLDSRVVRWAYLFEDKVPDRVSLCPLFWRVVLLKPLHVGGAVFFLTVTSPLWAPIWACCKLWDRYMKDSGRADRLSDHIVERYDNSVLVQRAIAFKTRVCPIVEIERPS